MKKLLIFSILIWGCAETEKKTISYQKKSPTVLKSSDSYSTENTEGNALVKETLARSEGKILRDYTDIADSSIGSYCYQGDFKKAFSVADEYYSTFKKNPGYWNQIGNCYYLMKDFKKAILYYNKAKGINPNYVPAVNNVGVVFQAQGDFKQALYFYKNAVNLAAGSKTPRFNMANLYLKFGNTNKACGIFNALASGSQMDSDILNARANCLLFNRNYSAAVSEFRKIPSEDLSKGYIGLNYSVALGLLGKKEEALDNYKNISQRNIGDLRNYYRSVGDYLNRI
jgi:tetratricopeptide (TPR) repeat protein